MDINDRISVKDLLKIRKRDISDNEFYIPETNLSLQTISLTINDIEYNINRYHDMTGTRYFGYTYYFSTKIENGIYSSEKIHYHYKNRLNPYLECVKGSLFFLHYDTTLGRRHKYSYRKCYSLNNAYYNDLDFSINYTASNYGCLLGLHSDGISEALLIENRHLAGPLLYSIGCYIREQIIEYLKERGKMDIGAFDIKTREFLGLKAFRNINLINDEISDRINIIKYSEV